jgi:hypothetical protein
MLLVAVEHKVFWPVVYWAIALADTARLAAWMLSGALTPVTPDPRRNKRD